MEANDKCKQGKELLDQKLSGQVECSSCERLDGDHSALRCQDMCTKQGERKGREREGKGQEEKERQTVKEQ